MDYATLFVEATKNQANGNLQLAMTQIDKILLEAPTFHPAWASRAAILQKLGHPFDAVLNFDRAIALVPDDAGYYNNRGTAKLDLEVFPDALDDFKRASNRNNKIAEVYNNIGIAYMRQRKIRQALEAYRKAVEIRPSYSNARLGVAVAHLMLGEYVEGFNEFECRWQTHPMAPRNLSAPGWEREKAKNKNDILLLYGEQGMGDVLQFCRYAAIAKQRWGGKVYLEVVHPLVRLLKGVNGVDGVIAFGEKIPSGVKAGIAMLSVPRVVGTTLQSVPSTCPYLPYDPYRAGLWRDRLKALPDGLLVGLCWAGMNRDTDPMASSIDSRRSMQLSMFAPLAAIKGISWVSLQLGPPKDQIRTPPVGMTIGDWSSDLYDFYDTAALVSALDLVITVDTSVVHLAGGMGKPTWLLSRYDACWRWLMDREDSPWYPTMRIFTQTKPYDWDGCVERMIMPLQALANQRRQLSAA